MSKKETVPNAWDDDWEAQADRQLRLDESTKATAAPLSLSRAERLAQHVEANRKLWESAEEADSFHFLAARDEVPLKSEFKPAVKVLSRKPTPKLISRNDPLTGESQLMLEDFRDEGDEGLRSNTLSPEEMRLKAQREREEKQRRYEEARKRLFGSASISPAPGSTSGSRDTQKPQVLNKPPESRDIRARGRCKGTRSSPVLPDRNEHQYGYEARGGTHSDARNKRELYDPQLESKPDFTPTLEQASYDSQQPKQERTAEPTIREPRQPKQSARGFDTLLQDKAV